MSTPDELVEQLEDVLDNVNHMLEFFQDRAKNDGVNYLYLRNSDGTFIIPPLLTAKASVLPLLYGAAKEKEHREKVEAALEKAKNSFLEGFNKGKTQVVGEE